jgi:hypothetical protein
MTKVTAVPPVDPPLATSKVPAPMVVALVMPPDETTSRPPPLIVVAAATSALRTIVSVCGSSPRY